MFGGERGIRTLDTLLTYTHFPGVLLQPLGHLTGSKARRLPDQEGPRNGMRDQLPVFHPQNVQQKRVRRKSARLAPQIYPAELTGQLSTGIQNFRPNGKPATP